MYEFLEFLMQEPPFRQGLGFILQLSSFGFIFLVVVVVVVVDVVLIGRHTYEYLEVLLHFCDRKQGERGAHSQYPINTNENTN